MMSTHLGAIDAGKQKMSLGNTKCASQEPLKYATVVCL